MKKFILVGGILILFIVIYFTITIFVIPPIGAVPEGRTVILFRYKITTEGKIMRSETKFIDSADAMCKRKMGYVNLLCRGFALANIAEGSTILLRLPYSGLLEDIAEWLFGSKP